MSRWGMVIDLDRCTGCGACMASCHVENNLSAVGPEQSELGRGFHWLRVLPEQVPTHEGVTQRYLPHLCVQCDNPPCVRVCPVHATYLSEIGIVAQVYGRCIGCRYCMAACPYNVKVFNWLEPRTDGGRGGPPNPDVSVRYKGVVEKCTFCHHRIVLAREEAAAAGRELRDGDVTTACAENCPSRAIEIGDLEDPDSRVSRLAVRSRAWRLHEDLGTEPKLFYLSETE